MRGNRDIYVSFDTIIMVTLFVCLSIEFVLLFFDSELFNFQAKLSIILGLFLLIVCVKRSIGGYPFKLFTIFLILYFVQRIILLSIDPAYFDFPIHLDETDINHALLFLFFSSITILMGFSFGIALSSLERLRKQSYLNYGIFKTNSYRKTWIKISYVILFAHLFVLLFLKQGFGVIPAGEFSWMLRPIRVWQLMFGVNILLLMQSHIKFVNSEKKALKVFIVLSVGAMIISGSRAALFSIPFAIIMAKFIIGDFRVKAKTIILLSLLIPFLSVYFTFINAYRGILQQSYADPSVTRSIDYYDLLNRINMIDSINFLSVRMNGFDLLVAALKKQDELSNYLNIKDSVLTIVDSLYPGSLFEHAIEPAQVIPTVLRNVDMSAFIFSGEHLNLIAMSFIYLGYFGGFIFLFIFSFITALVLFSKKDVVIKLIIVNILIFYTFETGFIESIVQNLS